KLLRYTAGERSATAPTPACDAGHHRGYCGQTELSQRCFAGACEEVCSSGTPNGACDGDATCHAGICEVPCDAQHLDGVCADSNQICVEGECKLPCGFSRPDGACRDGQECLRSRCADRCDAAHPNGICEHGGCIDGACDAACPGISASTEC